MGSKSNRIAALSSTYLQSRIKLYFCGFLACYSALSGAAIAQTVQYYKADGSTTTDLEAAAQSWRDDAEFEESNGLHNTKIEYAYAMGFTGKGIKVGIFDSGVLGKWSEFRGEGKLTGLHTEGVYAYSYLNYYKAGDPFSFNGNDPLNGIGLHPGYHGTHVAGIVGANRDGRGMMGAAFNAQLVAAITSDAGPEDGIIAGNDANAYTVGFNALMQSGVRIINNSWGIGFLGNMGKSNDPKATPEDVVAQYSSAPNDGTMNAAASVARAGILYLKSAGNKYGSEPDALGALPYFRPDIEDHWVTVANLSAFEDNATLSSSSSICGMARYYCLSAPGTLINSTSFYYDTKRKTATLYYEKLSGTSMSTPVVSGSLAVLMERYPYMSNKQVRDTLLTTAKHLGTSPEGVPDYTFGWGQLDMQKALHGPGQFLDRFDVVMPGGVTDTWSNDISDVALKARQKEDEAEHVAWEKTKADKGWVNGLPAGASDADKVAYDIGKARDDAYLTRLYEGGLTKHGQGQLVLAGNNTYHGETIIEDGELVIAQTGSVTSASTINGGLLTVAGRSADVTINAAGTLDVQTTGLAQNLILNGGQAIVAGSANDAAINAGLLVVSGQIADASVATSATLDIKSTGSAHNLLLNNGYINVDGKANNATINAGLLTVSGQVADVNINDAGLLDIKSTGSAKELLVNNGHAIVNGSAANTTINANSILGGSGRVGSLVAHAGGIVSPGNSIGTLTATGDAQFDKGSVFAIEVAPGGRNDRLNVAGATTLLGGVVNVTSEHQSGLLSPAQTLALLDQTYTILHADNGVNGTFEAARPNYYFIGADLAYDPNNVLLTLSRNNVAFADVGQTINQKAAANGLESLGSGNLLYDTMATTTLAENLPAALASLSGEIHASVQGALIEDNRFVRDAAMARIRSAFDGKPSPAATDANNQMAFWGQAYGSWNESDSDGNAAGYSRSIGGFVTGFDGEVADDWRLGILAGYSNSSLHASSGDASADSYQIGVYGGTQIDAVILSMGANFAHHTIETDRNAWLGTIRDRNSASYDANSIQLFGEAAYRFTTPYANIDPFAGLAYTHLKTDSFNETASLTSLSGAGQSTDVTVTTLGVRLSHDFTLTESTQVSARGMVGWNHAFGDVTPESRLAFAGGDRFTVEGLPIAKDAFAVEAGLDFNIGNATTLGVAYTGRFSSHAHDNAVKADLTVKF